MIVISRSITDITLNNPRANSPRLTQYMFQITRGNTNYNIESEKNMRKIILLGSPRLNRNCLEFAGERQFFSGFSGKVNKKAKKC